MAILDKISPYYPSKPKLYILLGISRAPSRIRKIAEEENFQIEKKAENFIIELLRDLPSFLFKKKETSRLLMTDFDEAFGQA